MSEHSVVHSTFSIERSYKASPERVFEAHKNPEVRRKWFVEGEGWEIDEYTLNLEEGATERGRFRYQGGPEITNITVYQDIVPNRRIVFAYSMTVGGKRISSSLATIQLVPNGTGTDLIYTEQGAFFDGLDNVAQREEGCRELLEKLALAVDM